VKTNPIKAKAEKDLDLSPGPNSGSRIRTCDLRVMGPTRCRIQIKDTEIVFCCDYIMRVFIDRKEILL
jgi:hypothetical protein